MSPSLVPWFSSLFGISAMPVSTNSGTMVSSLLVPPATVDGGTSLPILVKKPDTEMDTYRAIILPKPHELQR